MIAGFNCLDDILDMGAQLGALGDVTLPGFF